MDLRHKAFLMIGLAACAGAANAAAVTLTWGTGTGALGTTWDQGGAPMVITQTPQADNVNLQISNPSGPDSWGAYVLWHFDTPQLDASGADTTIRLTLKSNVDMPNTSAGIRFIMKDSSGTTMDIYPIQSGQPNWGQLTVAAGKQTFSNGDGSLANWTENSLPFDYAHITTIGVGELGKAGDSQDFNLYSLSIGAVPEPTMLGLAGLSGLALVRRRRTA